MSNKRDGQRAGHGARSGAEAPNTQGRSPDPIDEAIAAAEAPPDVRMVQMGGHFNATGRPFTVQVPEDLTAVEALALVQFACELHGHLQRQPKSDIVLPNAGLVLPT